MKLKFYLTAMSLFILFNQTANSQNVGINGTGSAPSSSAMLDVSSTTKGMLIPRVSLTSTTDVTTISSPATSLLVYNTNASMTNGSVGYWYYDGAAWVKFELTDKNWSITGNTGITASNAAIGSTVNNNFIGTTDLKSFVMATNSLERMRIASSGNIGIATTTPSNILSFGGNVSRTIWMERQTTAATGGSNLFIQSGGAYSGGTNLSGGDFNIVSGTSTGTGTSNIYLKTATAGASGTVDNAPSTKVTVLGNGNVGIGTTTPTNFLSLNGNLARTIWMERHTTAATAGNSLTVQAGGSYAGGTNLNGGDFNLSAGTSTGTGTSNVYIQTSTAGASGTTDNAPSTKMTVLGSGNVGINTTTPAQKLEISSGHVLLSNTNNTSDELRIQEPSTSGSNYTAFKAQAQASNITYTLPATQSANTVLTNDGSGNLTWGTAGSYLYARKASDETVTSSTTLQDDNDFTFTLPANQTYEITGLLLIDCGSTGKFKSQFVAPAGTTLMVNIFDNTSGLDDLAYYTAPSSTTTVGSLGISSSTDEVAIQGTVVVGGTGGTFKMQWAQSTSSGTSTIVRTWSYIKLVRVQ